MPQYERSLYEPSEEVRVFDGSEEDEDMEGSRLPLLIVLALLVLAMFAGFVWLAYTQGVARGRTETPVLTAQNGPARIAPQNPGGAEQAFKGFKIYEQPAPPDDEADAPQAAAPQVASQAAAPPPAIAKAEPAPVVKAAAPVAKATPAPVPAPVLARETPPAQPIAKPVAKPVIQPKPVAALPKAAAAPIGPATAPPQVLAAPPAKAAPPVKAAPAATPAAPAISGSYVLQIGAYKSQADADAAWKSYQARHAALLSGYGPDVARADLGDKGIWYRLRVAGFANKDVASALCDRLKADGGGCFLGK